MARTISIGAQGFADIREHGYFYVDKTDFIRQWWTSGDVVTLICRPRRFGKTLNMSTLEAFFSTFWANRAGLFEGLDVWRDSNMHAEQGKWPVIALSFAGAKGACAHDVILRMCERIAVAWRNHAGEIDSSGLSQKEADLLSGRVTAVSAEDAPSSLFRLCELLYRATGRPAIVLLDGYDTPVQEAWMDGFWHQVSEFVRSLFKVQ